MQNFVPESEHFVGLKMSGPDAIDFAHRMFSRDIKNLPVGEGRLCLLLSAEGKTTALFWLLREAKEELWLLTDHRLQAPLTEAIEHFHFAEKFTVEDLGRFEATYAEVLGPTSDATAEKYDGAWKGVWRGIEFSWRAGSTVGPEADWVAARLLHLVPSFGREWDQSSLVFDFGGEQLCDDKGCYSGQEVVERVRSRGGSGPRKLVCFSWSAPLPSPSEDLVVMNDRGEPIGSLTKTQAAQKALGFVRRGVEPGAKVQVGSTSGIVEKML